ncbi:M56 family metallopeptidase [Qipengyuania oceanensis]|uniref:Peptidase M56 domain-containing protein n=1 Tax=Qipengyuania oceanensis TaxID=1463597 RepID=A0A844YBG7_9SPHN|nr:M56 family metallopeptidase [Qipengyuania oceanensis]MXO61860.1 hypothetical protein [Qipengyuania oceanensis]
MSWLIDTLVWTGLLIALVLVLRRPISRHLGAGAAYALWCLPALRLVLPPLLLPAWMKPAGQIAATPAAPLATELSNADLVLAPVANVPVEQVSPTVIASIDWSTIAVLAWLAGALTFLVMRFRAYRRMRAVMLANAVEVGAIGKVRLVETPLTEAPIAFGVAEKIIALPEGFLDRTDRTVRDLALAHELAHHHGHDLLVNFAIQPLFALHWFNPLCWLGWHALRCDQEAACDARVVRQRPQEERARYAEVIAGFATSPRLALAAPMACPVLGDKSIIHRLRSLTMSSPSPRRRRLGSLGFAAAAFALPLTATISYAEAPQDKAPLPPAPPEAPGAPLPPDPPYAPDATDDAVEIQIEEAVQAIEQSEQEIAEVEREIAGVEREIAREEKRIGDADVTTRRKVRVLRKGEGALSEQERAAILADVSEAMADVRIALAEAKEARKSAFAQVRASGSDVVRIETRCENNDMVAKRVGADGKKVTVVCESAVTASALQGLREARREIAADPQMDSAIKAEVLRGLDEAIAEVTSEG